jgi:hypothetical protein
MTSTFAHDDIHFGARCIHFRALFIYMGVTMVSSTFAHDGLSMGITIGYVGCFVRI